MKSELTLSKLLLGVLYISIAVAIFATAILAVPVKNTPALELSLGGEKIAVDLANTPKSQEKGLSGHKPLALNEGMLFVFPSLGTYGFWMKDMSFPIDIIWFDENQQIVDVWEGATPSSYPQIHSPLIQSKYVLEVSSGFYLKNHLKKGDRFEL